MPDEDTSRDERELEQQYVTMLYTRLDGLRQYAANRLSTVYCSKPAGPRRPAASGSRSTSSTPKTSPSTTPPRTGCASAASISTDEHRYIGRLGILDEENDYETMLLDWRAPACPPVLPRHPRSPGRRDPAPAHPLAQPPSHGRQRRIPRSGGGTRPRARSPARTASRGESALLAALNAARTGQMNDIVETIQSEQDAIIRSEHKSVLVVQGGPGTGKTAVALHRAAYLLYTYRQQLAKSGVLIIGPNATFLDYIGQVLPSLGETGVLLSTIGDLYPGVQATRRGLACDAGEIKGSLDMLDVLKKAVRDRQEVPSRPDRADASTPTGSPSTARSSPGPVAGRGRRGARTTWHGRSSSRRSSRHSPSNSRTHWAPTSSTAGTCSAATTSPTCGTRCVKTRRS